MNAIIPRIFVAGITPLADTDIAAEAARRGLPLSTLASSKTAGWTPRIPFADGLRKTYASYLSCIVPGFAREG